MDWRMCKTWNAGQKMYRCDVTSDGWVTEEIYTDKGIDGAGK